MRYGSAMQNGDPADPRHAPPDRLAKPGARRAVLGAWTFDLPTGRFAASNHAGWHSHALTPIEMNDSFLDSALEAADRAAVHEAFERAATTKAEFDLQLPARRNGARHWVRMIGGARSDPDGAVRSLSGVIIDINETKRLEESLRERDEHLRSILETTPDGMVVIDQRGIIHSF